jgi:hypothetical protein
MPRRLAFVLFALLCGAAAAPSSTAQELLHLVDDRGKALSAPVEVCFLVELRTDCRPAPSGGAMRTPPRFFGLRVEGEDHGPVRLRREEMTASPDGSFRVTVLRKAILEVQRPRVSPPMAGGPAKPLTVSLYPPGDRDFREPLFRAQLAPRTGQLRIPSGNFVASLTAAPYAPDLQRLSARPASRVRLVYRQRSGWSLVVRCLAGAAGRPLSQAGVQLRAAPGFGQPETLIAEELSGADGLALISGVQAPVASLAAVHGGLLPGQAKGLVAAPGTFTFQSVTLTRGGRLRAVISLHGKPVAGATCRIFDVVPGAPPRQKELWTGEVDGRGVCLSAPLPEGLYQLAVQVPRSTGAVSRWVGIVPEQDAEEDVALTPCLVTGRVRRGSEAAAAYVVHAQPVTADHPIGAPAGLADKATTDEEGRYQLTLWTAGRYLLRVSSPAGGPISSHKLLATWGDDEQKVDFDLNQGGLKGTVANEEGRPLAKAWVGVTFLDAGSRVLTDDDGHFQLDLEGSGTAHLVAGKSGYLRSDAVEVPITENETAQATLVLRRDSTATGAVLTAAGVPVAGALVTSILSSPGAGPRLYDTTRSEADGSFEVRVPPGSPHVFVSGPGCPLFSAELLGARSDADAAAGAAVELHCPAMPAAVQLVLVDDQGKPISHAALILRQQGAIVPQDVLAAHLTLLGLSPDTDGSGRIVLAGLAPGDYDLFVSLASSEDTIAAGQATGFLASIALAPLATTELQVTLPAPGRAR